MKTLSALRTRATRLCLGSLLCLLGSGCHVGQVSPPRAWQAYTLPLTRPSGDWQAPRDAGLRRRLDAVVQEHYPEFQECVWRHSGTTPARPTTALHGSSSSSAPYIGRFGVDTSGKVTWLELSPDEGQLYGLRECLSHRLVRIDFSPAPTQQVMLVMTLPRLRSLRVSSLGDPSQAPADAGVGNPLDL